MIYIKYLKDNTYEKAGLKKNIALYVIHKVICQRGMGNQKVEELLIHGIPWKDINKYLQLNNAVLVYREKEPKIKIYKVD